MLLIVYDSLVTEDLTATIEDVVDPQIAACASIVI